jgi:anti-sigma factor RsiW
VSVDDTVLLAYVDGRLTPERRAEVDAVAATSPELAERLAAMQASVLPYVAAFDRQALPPIPGHLVRDIDDPE